MKKAIFIAGLMAAFAFAENNLDSLRAEIERLNAQLEIQRLNAEIHSIQQTQATEIEESKNLEEIAETQSGKEAIREARNNLKEAIRNNAASAMNNRAEKINNRSDEKENGKEKLVEMEIDTTAETVGTFKKIILDNRQWSRNNFVGIGGGPVVGVMYLSTKPIKKYLRELESVPDRDNWVNPLGNSNISSQVGNREVSLITGGFGYGNFGNGAIIGGGGYGILTQISSNVSDTTFVATVAGGYGGFLFGRGWGNRKNALSFTTLIGGGGLAVDVSKRFRGSAFDRPNNNIWDFENYDNIITEGSAFFALEPQLAYTHSFLRWFHIGVEGAALLMHSRRGFDWTDGFTNVNPSAKLRFVFGSI